MNSGGAMEIIPYYYETIILEYKYWLSAAQNVNRTFVCIENWMTNEHMNM